SPAGLSVLFSVLHSVRTPYSRPEPEEYHLSLSSHRRDLLSFRLSLADRSRDDRPPFPLCARAERMAAYESGVPLGALRRPHRPSSSGLHTVALPRLSLFLGKHGDPRPGAYASSDVRRYHIRRMGRGCLF